MLVPEPEPVSNMWHCMDIEVTHFLAACYQAIMALLAKPLPFALQDLPSLICSSYGPLHCSFSSTRSISSFNQWS